MSAAVTVQMNRERQVWRWLILINVLGKQNRVRAQVDEFLACNDASDYLGHLLVDQRFAARDRHHWRATFVYGPQRVFNAHSFLQDFFGVVDLAAAGTRQVALKQRFQHQN